MSDESLPIMGALLLQEWCATHGATHESLAEFLRQMQEAVEGDDMRRLVADLIAKYEAARLRLV
jgi:hypothetical protein